MLKGIGVSPGVSVGRAYCIHQIFVNPDNTRLEEGEVKGERFGLITTYYRIREELARMGKRYSYEQIREGVSILAGLRYELS